MDRRRWDTDERFSGIGSGRAFAPIIETLGAHLDRDGWVAENPEAHLLPHLERFCDRPEAPFRLCGSRLEENGVYEVTIAPTGVMPTPGLPIRAVLPLLAAIAETSVAVRQVDETTVECVTGMLDGDGPYAAHGHLIRLRIR